MEYLRSRGAPFIPEKVQWSGPLHLPLQPVGPENMAKKKVHCPSGMLRLHSSVQRYKEDMIFGLSGRADLFIV